MRSVSFERETSADAGVRKGEFLLGSCLTFCCFLLFLFGRVKTSRALAAGGASDATFLRPLASLASVICCVKRCKKRKSKLRPDYCQQAFHHDYN